MTASASSTSSTENSGSPRLCSNGWWKKTGALPASSKNPAQPLDRSGCKQENHWSRNGGEADHAPSHLLRGRRIQTLARLQKAGWSESDTMKREAVIVDAVRTPLGRRD